MRLSEEAAGNAFAGVKGYISSTIGNIINFAQVVKAAVQAIPAVVNKIGEAFGSVAQKIASVVVQIATSFSNLSSKAREAGSKVIKSFTQGIESAINSVTSAIQRLANAVSNIWSSMSMEASMAGSRVARNFSQSYNMSTSTLKAPTVQRATSSGRTSSVSSADSVARSIDALAMAINRQNTSPTNVNVELVGSARNIFDTVRVQNTKMVTATGYHALA